MVEVTEWENSVWLPFKTTVCLPDDVTVEWKHKDRTIFMYQSSQNQHLLQDEVYRSRTEMNEEPLRTGDLSLKLNNLQVTDHGVYICTVYNKSNKLLRQKVVTLSVRGEHKSCFSMVTNHFESDPNILPLTALVSDKPAIISIHFLLCIWALVCFTANSMMIKDQTH